MKSDNETWNSAMDIAKRIHKLAEGRDSEEILMALSFVLAQVLKQTTSNETEMRAEMERFVTAAVSALKLMRESPKSIRS